MADYEIFALGNVVLQSGLTLAPCAAGVHNLRHPEQPQR